MSYSSVQDCLSFNSYIPGHLLKKRTFRDQLAVPEALFGVILHDYHDHILSERQIAFRPTHDKIGPKYWWPTLSRDIQDCCMQCQACQRRKTAHVEPKFPTGHLSVERSFQRISIDLVECNSVPGINFSPRNRMKIRCFDDGPSKTVCGTTTCTR